MSLKIIAQHCTLCANPVLERDTKPDDAWVVLANGVAHLECANKATKERLFREEKADANNAG